MATAVKPETIPWGKRLSTHEAFPFYKRPGWNALADGQKWAAEGMPKEERHIVSSHDLFEEMRRAATTLPPFWITLNTEEDRGTDLEGRVGKKDEVVMLTIHGSGIMLGSPQSLQAAYMNRTPGGEPSLQQQKITEALSGKLPDGQQINVYTLKALMTEDPAKLPQVYAIAIPLKDLEGNQSGPIEVEKLLTDKIYLARAGHPETARQHVQMLKEAGIKEYGNYHRLAQSKPESHPSGRVLRANYDHGDGLDGGSGINIIARFVGVRKLEGA